MEESLENYGLKFENGKLEIFEYGKSNCTQ